MRLREGIDDAELREEIRGLAIGDFVKLTPLDPHGVLHRRNPAGPDHSDPGFPILWRAGREAHVSQSVEATGRITAPLHHGSHSLRTEEAVRT